MTAAAFKATYADWKVVKTRGVVQVVLEVPLSEEGAAYKALGGMPNPAEERWFGIARLNPEQKGEAEQSVSEVSRPSPPAGGAHKSWDELSPAQQAGILCDDDSFHAFLRERDSYIWGSFIARYHGGKVEAAVAYIHRHCGVSSRADIKNHSGALQAWANLVRDYRAWVREPAVVG